MRSSKSSKVSKIQKLLDKNRDIVQSMLNEKQIDFVVEAFWCEKDDDDVKVAAYVVCTESVDGAILPDMAKGTVSFLIYNQNLADHMKQEGFSDEEIEKNGKVWAVLENPRDFVTILAE